MEHGTDITVGSEADLDADALHTVSVAHTAQYLLATLGVPSAMYSQGSLFARSPIDGSRIGKLHRSDYAGIDRTLQRAQDAAKAWNTVPAARRGDYIRRIGDQLRNFHEPLAQLVTIETGKALVEARREVSFAIACCDQAFASTREIGQSAIRTERNGFWIQEVWLTLGATGCISPFNRPLSHFAGLCFMSLVCGNSVVWKPSERAPLCALAMQTILASAAGDSGEVPDGLVAVLFGGRDVGKVLAEDFRLRFLDVATSIADGRLLNTKMAQSFTRGALTLGGNNAAIICRSADIAAAVNSVAASASLSGGQHAMCTRRLFVHTDIYDTFVAKLKSVFAHLRVGDPRQPSTMVGPLIDSHGFETMQRTLTIARNAGAIITGGARIDMPRHPGGYYVRPAIVEVESQGEVMLRETLSPILFVTRFENLEDALQMDAAAEAGMASAIFTHSMAEVEEFVRVTHAGMVNVNTLHASYEVEIAPAGARASGGGRLPSTASWKVFVQRCILTVNMGNKDGVPDLLGMTERGEI